MKTMILAAVAAVGLCLGTATQAKAQYYYYPNTGYTMSYGYPGVTSYYYPGTAYSYYPYGSAYYNTQAWMNPYASYYPGVTQYYNWDWYNPYTNQYRTWRWYRRF